MTEEQVRAFLIERKGKPEDIQKILDGLSAKEVQSFAKKFGQPIPDDAAAEDIASRNRKLFVEEITINEAGGRSWNTIKNSLDK